MATTVQQGFSQLKSNLEITGLQGTIVSIRQQSVRKVMEAGFTVLDSFLTGSYSRQTMISPLSEADIDIFFVLDASYWRNYANGQNGGQAGLLDRVKRTLLRTYTKTPDISRNGQAVTIRFNDFVVDVIPGFYRDGGGFLIPDSISNLWIATNPKQHVKLVAESNKAHGGDFVPLVKMIKAWNKSHTSFFRSFHLEVLALSILQGVTISDYPSGLRYFFQHGQSLISQKNPDPAGYGDDVGRYLNSQQKIQDAVARFQRAYELAVRAENNANRGNIREAFQDWKRLMGGYFPNYG